MKLNVARSHNLTTHEGGKSSPITSLQQLRRLSLACMMWEDSFYVDGQAHAKLLADSCDRLSGEEIIDVAMEAHRRSRLRHLPLFLILQALKKKSKCALAIYEICSRPDQMCELLAMYWKDGKKPIPAQMKKGLAKAFTRFDEYQLAKYNRDTAIKLRDVLFLCHAKPKDDEQAFLWKKLVDGKLAIPETWEVQLSAGGNKKEVFQSLLEKGKLGSLAVLRNLRNMHDAGVPKELVESALLSEKRPQLPFQYLAAAKACPQWEDIIDKGMLNACKRKETIPGLTVIMVDVSGSMDYALSAKSQMMRMDAACGLAILLREVCEKSAILSFSDKLCIIPTRTGMALRDSIVTSQPHSGTALGKALEIFESSPHAMKIDRIVVITDEQASDTVKDFPAEHCYILNVGTYANGISNSGKWHVITGFSENCVDYIREYESFEKI